jgi:hypothetical protein
MNHLKVHNASSSLPSSAAVALLRPTPNGFVSGREMASGSKQIATGQTPDGNDLLGHNSRRPLGSGVGELARLMSETTDGPISNPRISSFPSRVDPLSHFSVTGNRLPAYKAQLSSKLQWNVFDDGGVVPADSAMTNYCIPDAVALDPRFYGVPLNGKTDHIVNLVPSNSFVFRYRFARHELDRGTHLNYLGTPATINQELRLETHEVNTAQEFCERYMKWGVVNLCSSYEGSSYRNYPHAVCGVHVRGKTSIHNYWRASREPVMTGSHLWFILKRVNEGNEMQTTRRATYIEYREHIERKKRKSEGKWIWQLVPLVMNKNTRPGRDLYAWTGDVGCAFYVGRVTQQPLYVPGDSCHFEPLVRDALGCIPLSVGSPAGIRIRSATQKIGVLEISVDT